MKRLAFQVFTLAGMLAGCNTDIAVDPEGYLCDPGNVCPAGYSCVQGVCRSNSSGNLCTGVVCNAPPQATCKDAQTRVGYAASGACDGLTGACTYAATETTCAQGCQMGQCVGDLCAGVSCNTPPAATCADANTLRTFAAGTCDEGNGQCAYPQTDTPCANGCLNGACVNQDLCANVTCNTPPAPSCNGKRRVSWASAGTCDMGTGTCSYAEMPLDCPFACVLGECVAPPKTFNQIGPSLRSQVTAVDIAPQSSGNHVVVVGPQGFAAKWNGSTWSTLATNTTDDLTSVWLRSQTSGYIVGHNGVALRYDGTALSALTLPGSSGIDLVSVHGKNLHVLIAGADGTAWRSTDGVTFTKAPAPPATHTYEMNQAFVADDDRERIAGLCTAGLASRPCILYAGAPTATTWYIDPSASSLITGNAFSAVGPNATSGYAFVARDTTVYRHEGSSGDVTTSSTPTGLLGGAVVGITDDSGSATNATFFLTTRTSAATGRLYRWTGGTPTELLRFYFAHQALSRNASGGAIAVDSRTTAANIYRRGAVTDEALDLAEDWVDVAVAPTTGRRVLVNAYGDVALSAVGNGGVWTFDRSPATQPDFVGVVAAAGYALLFGDGGEVFRWTPANGHAAVIGAGTTNLNDGCSNSDTEVYLVGDGGKIFHYNGTSLQSMSSGTTQALQAVVCTGGGEAFAVGAGGAVLKLSAGTWSAYGNAAPTQAALTAVWASAGGELFVAGDNVLLRYANGTWTTLAGRSGLTQLHGISGTELYGVGGDTVYRFDGASWQSVFKAPSALTGGVQSSSVIVLAGSSGLVVEAK